MAKNEATASVIMAKKIAFTRREKSPMRNDRTSDSATAAAVPMAIELQLTSIRESAMAAGLLPGTPARKKSLFSFARA